MDRIWISAWRSVVLWPLVDVTDIYPTLCAAVGVTIPNAAQLDGLSFWPQVLGAEGEPRQVIYTWINSGC